MAGICCGPKRCILVCLYNDVWHQQWRHYRSRHATWRNNGSSVDCHWWSYRIMDSAVAYTIRIAYLENHNPCFSGVSSFRYPQTMADWLYWNKAQNLHPHAFHPGAWYFFRRYDSRYLDSRHHQDYCPVRIDIFLIITMLRLLLCVEFAAINIDQEVVHDTLGPKELRYWNGQQWMPFPVSW